MYEEIIANYKNLIADRKDSVKDIKEEITRLKELLKEHKNNLYTQKGTEKRIYIGTKKEGDAIIKIYKTASEIKEDIETLKESVSKKKEFIDKYKERKKSNEDRLKDLKKNAEFPVVELDNLSKAAANQERQASDMLTMSTDAILEAEKVLATSKKLLKGYHTQLSKLLGIDISDKTLGLEGLSEDEKNIIKTNILLEHANKLRQDTTGDSYLFPEAEFNLASQMSAIQTKINDTESILKDLEDIEVRYTDIYQKARVEKVAAKSQFNKLLSAYEKIIGKSFKELDVYDESVS